MKDRIKNLIYCVGYKKTLAYKIDGVDICIEKRGRDKYLSMFHPNKNHGDTEVSSQQPFVGLQDICI